LKEGRILVGLARSAVVTYLKAETEIPVPDDLPQQLRQKSGVFVTLNSVTDGKSLRGCIGFPLPEMQLAQATIRSAIEAATGDPRFPPVTLEEFEESIATEVSVLTPPSLMTVNATKEYVKQIRVGRDGLMIERGWRRGLLLPQVPVECGWDEEEFICHCCIKAGLPPDSWLIDDTKVYRFEAIIFEEESPGGTVKIKPLRKEERE
jgi:hypothetical protein